MGTHPDPPRPHPTAPLFTRQSVIAAATAWFPTADLVSILAILGEYGLESYEDERERAQPAILALSAGRLDQLHYYLRRAKQDYRDVLYWAEHWREHDHDFLPQNPAAGNSRSGA